MKKHTLLLCLLASAASTMAQTPSNAQFQIPYPKPDAQLFFDFNGEGKPTPIEWGFDLAWLSEDNVRHGIAFSGKEVVDIVRLSFQPTHSVATGQFSSEQLKALNNRANIVKKYCKEDITYNMNCDHASLDEWYNDDCKTSAERAEHWVKLFDMTADYYKSKGLTNLVSISPLNEPDYEWHALPTFKHRKADFLEMCKLMKTNEVYKEKYADVRLCGGNTLNDDMAYEWWNYLKAYLDEGNTHQLAGSFDNYASFFQKLRAAGHHATNDELHNTMEAMVGVEYGMQTGIWWGSADYARGQLMKATYQGNPGVRLGYAEHRKNWTSAAVYRQPEGNVQAFIGSSERQAATTNYEFISRDRDVFFKGQGPMRHFVMEIPGGTGYQQGQTNAEVVFDIQSGADVQPYINGKYRIVNKYCNTKGNKGKYLGFSTNPGTGWKQLQQNLKPSSATNQGYTEWLVTPVDSRVGGDYSHYDIRMAGNEELRIDILNWGLSSGAQVGTIKGGNGNNEQWYLQYAGDGWFYIRSKHSNLALCCSSTSTGSGSTTQATFEKGNDKLLWRFIPVDADYDREAPEAPANITATAQTASIMLTWDAVEAADLSGYDILRTEKGVEDWNIIARGLTGTSFIDNTAEDDKVYLYAVRSSDKALNNSEMKTSAEISVSGEKGVVCQLDFDNNLNDASVNGNHALCVEEPVYQDKSTYVKQGTASFDLTSGKNYVMLPSTIGNHNSLTISCWVRRTNSSATWERIFDFGNGTDQYMFLTPNSGSKMRLEMKCGGTTETVDATALTVGYKHIAVTIDGDNGKACIYINGELKGTKEDLTIKPSDIKGVCNYIGKSQFASDPIFKGNIDDFRVYNYALSAEEIAAMQNPETDGIQQVVSQGGTTSSPTNKAYDLNGRPATGVQHGIKIEANKKIAR